MQIVFSDGNTVDVALADTPLSAVYTKIYKHLGHVPIPFRDWDNPFYVAGMTVPELVEKLILYASKVSVQIDKQQCLQQDQGYFNHIHEIYEKNYNGDPAWLAFHEHIHLCEKLTSRKSILRIDYREKSGLLEKIFDHSWLKHATTKIKAGDVFVQWAELGKTPYGYWRNNEPTDITRMCELAKPWLTLRPMIAIALADIDTLENIDITGFQSWWSQYSDTWCAHWNIPDWTIDNIQSVVVLGHVPDVKLLIQQLTNNTTPVWVSV